MDILLVTLIVVFLVALVGVTVTVFRRPPKVAFTGTAGTEIPDRLFQEMHDSEVAAATERAQGRAREAGFVPFGEPKVDYSFDFPTRTRYVMVAVDARKRHWWERL